MAVTGISVGGEKEVVRGTSRLIALLNNLCLSFCKKTDQPKNVRITTECFDGTMTYATLEAGLEGKPKLRAEFRWEGGGLESVAVFVNNVLIETEAFKDEELNMRDALIDALVEARVCQTR